MQNEPKVHVNPPLTALNAAAREAAEAARTEQVGLSPLSTQDKDRRIRAAAYHRNKKPSTA